MKQTDSALCRAICAYVSLCVVAFAAHFLGAGNAPQTAPIAQSYFVPVNLEQRVEVAELSPDLEEAMIELECELQRLKAMQDAQTPRA